jgi:hypothetical protein
MLAALSESATALVGALVEDVRVTLVDEGAEGDAGSKSESSAYSSPPLCSCWLTSILREVQQRHTAFAL